jgi:hypothetical protein
VDKAHYLVYQEDSTSKMTIPGATEPMNTKQTVKFDSVTVDEPISPEVFTFTPPSGATEMDTSKEIEHIKALKKTLRNNEMSGDFDSKKPWYNPACIETREIFSRTNRRP